MKVLKILVVDDEKIILNGIKNMLEKVIKFNFELDIVTASNVPQAIETLRCFTPDLVFTDISMPVKDGFDLIRHIRETFEKMDIVILTSYADFEYARLGIQYHIIDFILKPINTEILQKTVEAIYEKKMKEEAVRLESVKLELRSMMLYDLSPSELSSTKEEVYQLFSYPYYTVVVIEAGQLEMEDCTVIEEVLLRYYDACYCFLLQEQNRIVSICNHAYFSVKSINLHHELEAKLKGRETTIGASISASSYKELYALYSNASQRIFYNKYIGRNNIIAEIALLTYQECIHIFLENNIEKMNELLEQYLSSIRMMSEEINSPKVVYKSFFYNIRLYLENSSIEVDGAILESTEPIEDWWQLIPEISRQLVKLKKKIWKKNSNSDSDEQIRQLLGYISAHYQEDVSLEDLARSIGLHPNYVCGLFKKNIGKSFLTCLHEERIQQIKKLLVNTTATIEQIATDVGYNSASQMARVFRKYEGISPSDFRGK